jgi:hypothetical protein
VTWVWWLAKAVCPLCYCCLLSCGKQQVAREWGFVRLMLSIQELQQIWCAVASKSMVGPHFRAAFARLSGPVEPQWACNWTDTQKWERATTLKQTANIGCLHIWVLNHLLFVILCHGVFMFLTNFARKNMVDDEHETFAAENMRCYYFRRFSLRSAFFLGPFKIRAQKMNYSTSILLRNHIAV